MELLLNLFWFLVALASVGLWWTRWSRANRSRGRLQRSIRSAVGLCCVLVLLFFAISLTDDLQQVPAVSEDINCPRRPLQIWKGSPISAEPGKHAAPLAVVDVSKAPCYAAEVVGRVVQADAASPLTAFNRPFQGRAPPSPSA